MIDAGQDGGGICVERGQTAEVEAIVAVDPVVVKWLEGKPPKKIIYVAGKMINVVI